MKIQVLLIEAAYLKNYNFISKNGSLKMKKMEIFVIWF